MRKHYKITKRNLLQSSCENSDNINKVKEKRIFSKRYQNFEHTI